MTFVFLAGIGNSGEDHWQYHWYRAHGGHWVEHEDWDAADRDRWVDDLDRTLTSISGPRLLICHSLGCVVAVEWAKHHRDPELAGAFFVSVPDVEGPSFPKQASGFTSMVGTSLPLPAVMVASSNDPYATLDYAKQLAAQWHIELVAIGAKGHINTESQLGAWREGQKIFEAFAASVDKAP